MLISANFLLLWDIMHFHFIGYHKNTQLNIMLGPFHIVEIYFEIYVN